MKINNDHRIEGDNITQMNCPKNNEKFAPGNMDTIVIHYTAGRSAESSANFLISPVKASAHLVIGREGEIYQMVPFDTISWHAGNSSYGNRKWLNKYSIGIELDNAGVLTKVGTEYQAWFGKKYQANEVVHAIHRNESSAKYWHTYTEQQIEKCRQVCDLLINKYKPKTILGHEEISPGRKQDPGPAFPLDKFRENLLSQNRSDEPYFIDKEGIVVTNLLNIRSDAGVSFKKVAIPLPRGTKVKVLEERNGWYKVETSIEGWVSKGLIDIS
ncbi:MAG: N-acetylmuramoyl-L-alanine amidase [Bacteroidales bacterium]|nr:N-acetylmuramoyl-L-alanine amidase [Bacteroidales bacterium]